MSPKVSLIIPTKNNEKTIKKCLKSCKAQSYKNIEIIVIDNFSTDKTTQICKKFKEVKLEIFGPERNLQRPRGAEIATGDWLVFIDSDMNLSPQLIEDCIAHKYCLRILCIQPPFTYTSKLPKSC